MTEIRRIMLLKTYFGKRPSKMLLIVFVMVQMLEAAKALIQKSLKMMFYE